VREAMRKLRGREADPRAIAGDAGVEDVSVQRFVTDLRDAGLLVQTRDVSGVSWYTTLAGNALANATAAKPVRRAVAERHLAEFFDRVREVNASDYYLYWVEQVVVFGSFLDESAATVGDVDVAIELVTRFADSDEFMRTMAERSDEAARAGRQFANVAEQVGWGELEVRRFLKGRSRVISMTDVDDRILEQTEARVVYQRGT
jgi:predicted nucleotidyltransferase